MFDLNQIRCFVVVAEELHFCRAASRLNMSQPPLSRQIQVLERILEVQLLERTSRSVKLTPAGRSFLPEARRIMTLAESAAQLAKRVGAGKSGSIRLTFTPTSAYSFLPSLMERASQVMPDIDLDLSEMATVDQVEALLNGQADIGLIWPPVAHTDLNSICVLEESLLIAVPQNNPLAAHERLSVEDISTHPFIMYSPDKSRYFHDVVMSIFSTASVVPRYAQHVGQIHLMMSLVSSGMGCAIVPESARNLHYDGVVLRPLILERPKLVELYMVWRKDNEDPLIDRLVDCAPQAIMCAAE